MAEAARRRRLLEMVLVAVVVMVLAAGARYAIAGPDDLTDLRRLEQGTGLDMGPESAWFATGLNGDGAAFAIMAADPLGRDVGKSIKFPAFRYSRAGFSWAAAAVVLGDEGLVLLGLSLVGLISIGLVASLGVRLYEERGVWAWALIVNPALYLGFVSDTAEPLAVFLLATSLMGSRWWGPVALAVVRPSYLVGIAGRWKHFLLGLGVAGVARLFWVFWFDDSLTAGLWALGLPLRGVMESPSPLGFLVVGAGLVTLVVGGVRRDWSWIASGLLVASLSVEVLRDPINAVRAAGMLPVLWAFGPGYRGSGASKNVVDGTYPEQGVRST